MRPQCDISRSFINASLMAKGLLMTSATFGHLGHLAYRCSQGIECHVYIDWLSFATSDSGVKWSSAGVLGICRYVWLSIIVAKAFEPQPKIRYKICKSSTKSTCWVAIAYKLTIFSIQASFDKESYIDEHWTEINNANLAWSSCWNPFNRLYATQLLHILREASSKDKFPLKFIDAYTQWRKLHGRLLAESYFFSVSVCSYKVWDLFKSWCCSCLIGLTQEGYKLHRLIATLPKCVILVWESIYWLTSVRQ